MPVGLAGSSPFGLHTKLVNQLLMDSVKAKWSTYCTDPSVDEISWWDNEPTHTHEIEMSFETLNAEPSFNERPLGWNRERWFDYCVIHMYVVHSTSEEMPPYLINMINALKTMIMVERKALVPNSEFVRLDRIFQVPKENPAQARWHWYCSVAIAYTEIMT